MLLGALAAARLRWAGEARAQVRPSREGGGRILLRDGRLSGRPGDTVEIAYRRGNETRRTRLTLRAFL